METQYFSACQITFFYGLLWLLFLVDKGESMAKLNYLMTLSLLVITSTCFSVTYKIHMSSVWYPLKKRDLLNKLQQHHEQSGKKYSVQLQSDKIKSIIVPHAGFDYSGDIAAAAYRLIKPGTFKRVIILAPSHYHSFTGLALPDPKYDAYKNMLGALSLDTHVLKKLAKQPLVQYNYIIHDADHAIALQLPFIQKYCGSTVEIVPIMVGQVNMQQALSIAQMLYPFLDEQTLLVVSSDMTHYGNRFDFTPFTKNITQEIYDLDSSLTAQIQHQSLPGFYKQIQKTGATVCGRHPIMILLALLEQRALGDVDSYVVAYDTSASDRKNPEHSVSYLSLVISQEKKDSLSHSDCLTGYEKSVLLALARARLQQVVNREKKERSIIIPGLLTDSLFEPSAAFVTLNKFDEETGQKQLRGCVGTLAPSMPLYQAVWNMTKSAALADNRFTPVTVSELNPIQISISVLSQPHVISSVEDIVLGRDGIIMQQGIHSATYLPKVAFEQGWNLEQTLESLAQKAGLGKNAWQDPKTIFKRYQSNDFSEDKDALNWKDL